MADRQPVDYHVRAAQILRFAQHAAVPWRTKVTEDDQDAARMLLKLSCHGDDDGDDDDDDDNGTIAAAAAAASLSLSLSSSPVAIPLGEGEPPWPQVWDENPRSLVGALVHFRKFASGAQWATAAAQLEHDDDLDDDGLVAEGQGRRRRGGRAADDGLEGGQLLNLRRFLVLCVLPVVFAVLLRYLYHFLFSW